MTVVPILSAQFERGCVVRYDGRVLFPKVEERLMAQLLVSWARFELLAEEHGREGPKGPDCYRVGNTVEVHNSRVTLDLVTVSTLADWGWWALSMDGEVSCEAGVHAYLVGLTPLTAVFRFVGSFKYSHHVEGDILKVPLMPLPDSVQFHVGVLEEGERVTS